MQKTLLITGSTDGIGLETAKKLVSTGHQVLLHGRSSAKLKQAELSLAECSRGGAVTPYLADLSRMSEVEQLAQAVAKNHPKLDVLINNAGVFGSANPITPEGLDLRFVVNTVAPYLLAKRLLPQLSVTGRIINLSSAAQSPVNHQALEGQRSLSDGAAYAQSKLALTMWSRHLGLALKGKGPTVVAVNPKSLLGSKMVQQAYGVAGGSLSIGADILVRASLSEEFADATGSYFDNDIGRFSSPHPDALDPMKSADLTRAIERILSERYHIQLD